MPSEAKHRSRSAAALPPRANCPGVGRRENPAVGDDAADVRLLGSEEDRERELRHALDLREARESMVALLLELPAGCRAFVLDGVVVGARRWSLERLETCCERLELYGAGSDDPPIARAIELARSYGAAIDRAREALVLANVGIVPHVVRRFRNGTIPYADLVQDGHVGLLRAVDRFDPDRGHRFSTYAYWWIRRSLSEAFGAHARLIRLPESLREDLRAMRSARNELRRHLGRLPTHAELAERMNVSTKKVKKLSEVVPDPTPLEELLPAHEDERAMLLGDAGDDPLACALGRELRRTAQEALELLDERARTVIRLRFGFDDGEDMTLEQVGRAVGLSRERVRQIERGALEKIERCVARRGVAAC